MQLVLYFLKSLRNGCYRLWREYIYEDRSIYQTVALPMLRSTLLSKRLYKKMIVFTCIVISVVTIQNLFLTLFDFSFLRAVVVIFFLTTLLWLLVVWAEIMNDGLWTTFRRVWK